MRYGHERARPSSLDRLEALLEVLVNRHLEFEQEHKQLLTAQMVLTDRVDRIAESQLETTEKLNALISIVDEFIRNRPR